MYEMKRICLLLLLILILNISYVPEVLAYTEISSTPLALITDRKGYQNLGPIIAADTTDSTATFTQVTVSWLIQPGDRVAILWYYATGAYTQNITNDVDSSLSGRNVTIPMPTTGAPYYSCRLVIYAGSTEGMRYMWLNNATNSHGNTGVWPDPDTQEYTPPPPPPPPAVTPPTPPTPPTIYIPPTPSFPQPTPYQPKPSNPVDIPIPTYPKPQPIPSPGPLPNPPDIKDSLPPHDDPSDREPVTPKDTPQRDPVIPKDTPERDPVIPKDTPERDPVTPKDTPQRDPVIPKDTPERDPVIPRDNTGRDPVIPRDEPYTRDPVLKQ